MPEFAATPRVPPDGRWRSTSLPPTSKHTATDSAGHLGLGCERPGVKAAHGDVGARSGTRHRANSGRVLTPARWHPEAPFGARGSTAKLVIPCARCGASAQRHFWGGGDAASSVPPIDATAGRTTSHGPGTVQRFCSCHPGTERVEAQALGPTCLADPLSPPSALDRQISWAHLGQYSQPPIRPETK
jgi:hypothetical protein